MRWIGAARTLGILMLPGTSNLANGLLILSYFTLILHSKVFLALSKSRLSTLSLSGTTGPAGVILTEPLVDFLPYYVDLAVAAFYGRFAFGALNALIVRIVVPSGLVSSSPDNDAESPDVVSKDILPREPRKE